MSICQLLSDCLARSIHQIHPIQRSISSKDLSDSVRYNILAEINALRATGQVSDDDLTVDTSLDLTADDIEDEDFDEQDNRSGSPGPKLDHPLAIESNVEATSVVDPAGVPLPVTPAAAKVRCKDCRS